MLFKHLHAVSVDKYHTSFAVGILEGGKGSYVTTELNDECIPFDSKCIFLLMEAAYICIPHM